MESNATIAGVLHAGGKTAMSMTVRVSGFVARIVSRALRNVVALVPTCLPFKLDAGTVNVAATQTFATVRSDPLPKL